MIKKLTIAAGFAFLAGCSILPDRPPLNYYDFSILTPPATVISSKKLPASVRVNLPDIATPYNSPKLYIKGKDNRFYATNINRLVASPNDIIGDDLRQWLDKTGPWSMVLAPNSLASPDYQMTIYVSELFANASVQQPGDTVISMDVSVTKASNDKLVFNKHYQIVTPIEQESIPALIKSYSVGFNNLFEELSKDLNHKFIK